MSVQVTRIKRQRQAGLSLVELMVALALGVVITTGVLNVFIASKRGYYEDEQMANMQENARFALRMLRREISLAGYLGGQPDVSDAYASTVTVTDDCAVPWAVNVAAGPLEFANDVAASYTDKCVKNALNDAAHNVVSDVIAVRRTADDFTVSPGAFPAPTYTAGQNPAADKPSSAAMVNALYFVNQNCPPVGGVVDPDPCLLYGKDVDKAAVASATEAVAQGGDDYFQASMYYAKTFYVRDYSSVAGDDIPCLVVNGLDATPAMAAQCMVEGIQAVQLEFGLDLDGDRVPNKYVEDLAGTETIDGNAIQRVTLVTSAKVYILVRSTNEVQGHLDTKTYTVGKKAMGPFNDKFYRRVYNTAVRVPNIIQIDQVGG